MRASHADVYPKLLQDTREPGDHAQDCSPHFGCRFVVLSHPAVELRAMALHVCVAPCLLHESAQCALDCAMRPVPGSRICSKKGWNGCVARDCLHMSPSLPFLRAHVDRGPASGVAPRSNAVAILHCAFCGSSVRDLCMAVQHVPASGLPCTEHDGLLFWKHFTV